MIYSKHEKNFQGTRNNISSYNERYTICVNNFQKEFSRISGEERVICIPISRLLGKFVLFFFFFFFANQHFGQTRADYKNKRIEKRIHINRYIFFFYEFFFISFASISCSISILFFVHTRGIMLDQSRRFPSARPPILYTSSYDIHD